MHARAHKHTHTHTLFFRFQNIFLCCSTSKLHCFLSSHWPSFRFLSFTAFLVPSIQFFFSLPHAQFLPQTKHDVSVTRTNCLIQSGENEIVLYSKRQMKKATITLFTVINKTQHMIKGKCIRFIHSFTVSSAL